MYKRQADAIDDVSVRSVTFTIDGVGQSPDTVAPYSIRFVVPVGIGSLTIEAIATDNFGKTSTANVTVNVMPSPPPTVSITSPLQGVSLVEGSEITITADATDDISVRSVTFTIDGVGQPPDTVAPYKIQFTVPVGTVSYTHLTLPTTPYV